MTLTGEELRTVAEDLEYLRKSWGEGITDAEIRRGSAVLRRLVVEATYGNAWRSAGFAKQPSVVSVNLEGLLAGQDLENVQFALAGGGRHGGFVVGGMSVHQGETIESLKAKTNYESLPMEHQFSLTEFAESICAVVEGELIKRRELVQYFANTKGGVHLGVKRERERELVERICQLEGKVNHTERDGLYFELQSMAQNIGKSKDTLLFIETVRS